MPGYRRYASIAMRLPRLSAAAQEEEELLLRVPFAACLETFAAEQAVEDYMSAAAGRKTTVRAGRSGGPRPVPTLSPQLSARGGRSGPTPAWSACRAA